MIIKNVFGGVKGRTTPNPSSFCVMVESSGNKIPDIVIVCVDSGR